MKFFRSHTFTVISAIILFTYAQGSFSQCACQNHNPKPQKPKTEQTNDKVTAEISVGELIDKITILMIKAENITNPAKLVNIHTELESLIKTRNKLVPQTVELKNLTNHLLEINKKLWVIEDDIRDKERHKCFDQEFIELARSVYYTNDERCKVKRAINDMLGSRLVEEKSYAAY